MVEDEATQQQMTVMNDRSQGGSAYSNGRIELMIHRRGYGEDYLGIPDSINEADENGKGISVNAKYYLQFTNNRQEAFEGIEYRYLLI